MSRYHRAPPSTPNWPQALECFAPLSTATLVSFRCEDSGFRFAESTFSVEFAFVERSVWVPEGKDTPSSAARAFSSWRRCFSFLFLVRLPAFNRLQEPMDAILAAGKLRRVSEPILLGIQDSVELLLQVS